jgi:pimeloyl-ACP methyl ester carboxylesterase
MPRDDCVILLHGLARTSKSMLGMAEALAARGYLVINADYPSREKPVEELAPAAIRGALERCRRAGARQVSFVTHSLGGILVRYYLKHFPLPVLGRVVMLSPPNGGSEVADRLVDWPAYRWLNGPAGQQLITGPRGLPQRLGPVDFPLGVITGDRHAFFDAWLAGMFPGPNDGKVSVERARVKGMHDFLVLPYTHPFIMDEPEVIEQTLYFLRHGRFRRKADS